MYDIDDPDYARQRLVKTVIMHRGATVIVDNVERNGKHKCLDIIAREILSGKQIADRIHNYDLKPIKLGFINLGFNCLYAVRTPLRNDWRQGFRFEQVSIPFNPYGAQLFDYTAVAHTAENDFPNITNIKEILRKKNGILAWCRTFAIDNKNKIFYRGFGEVGEFTDVEEGKFKLKNEFFWVEDRLKEVL